MKSRRDNCDIFALRVIGKKIEKNLRSIMRSSFRRVRLRNFFNLENCGSVCRDQPRARVTGRGRRKKLVCLDNAGNPLLDSEGNQVSISCRKNQAALIEDGIKEKIKCIYKINPSLAAQLIGLITSNNLVNKNSRCKIFKSRSRRNNRHCDKTKIKCISDPNSEKGFLGAANLITDSGWPSVEMLSPQCTSNGGISTDSFKSTLIHEMIHLLGYAHGETPELAYACEVACDAKFENPTTDTGIKGLFAAKKVCSGNYDPAYDQFYKPYLLELPGQGNLYKELSHNINPNFSQRSSLFTMANMCGIKLRMSQNVKMKELVRPKNV